jgi:tripartite-type tricarboxylate transporter receptor subunit TctC
MRAVCASALALFVAFGGAAWGQSPAAYPTRMVRILVPFSAGSMSDILAREMAERLNRKWNQPVIVENRPGVVGTAVAAKAPADGYTLLLVSNGHVILNRINVNLPFDAVKDFKGVSLIARLPVIVVVPNELPVRSLREFAALVRSKPGAMNYSSAGLGSTSNIAAELFLHTQELKMVHVPYKGAMDAYTSVIRGDTQAFFTPSGVGEDLIAAGQVRALAVSGPTRLPKFPDVSTFAEAGFPDAAYEAWFGLLVPARVPAELVETLNRDVAEVMAIPEVKRRFAEQGVTATATSAAEFSELLRNDAERLGTMFDPPSN